MRTPKSYATIRFTCLIRKKNKLVDLEKCFSFSSHLPNSQETQQSIWRKKNHAAFWQGNENGILSTSIENYFKGNRKLYLVFFVCVFVSVAEFFNICSILHAEYSVFVIGFILIQSHKIICFSPKQICNLKTHDERRIHVVNNKQEVSIIFI